MEDLPLTNVIGNEEHRESPRKASTWKMIKLFVWFQFITRKRTTSFIPYWIVSVFFVSTVGVFGFWPFASQEDVRSPVAVDALQPRLEYFNMFDCVFVCPETDYTKRIMLNSGIVNYEFADSLEQMLENVSYHNNNIGIHIDVSENVSNITYYKPFLESDAGVIPVIDSMLRDKGLSIAVRKRAYPTVKNLIIEPEILFYLVYVPYGALMMLVNDAALNQEPRDNKMYFLLRINGMSIPVMALGFIAVHLIEQAPLIATAIHFFCLKVEMNRDASVSLFTYCLLIENIAMITLHEVFCTIFTSKHSLGVYLSVLVSVIMYCGLGMTMISFIPESILTLCMIGIPQFSLMMVMKLMLNKGAKGSGLTWKDLDFSADGVSVRYALACQLWNLLLCVMVNFIVNMCGNMVYGLSPVGWRNMFNISAWRRALRRNRQSEYRSTRVQLENIRKVYNGDIVAVDDLSITLNPGDVVIAIGPNGSGKSTLLNILSGTIERTSGEIMIDGEEVGRDFTPLYSRLGIVFQDDSLAEKVTAREHLQIISQLNGASEEESANEIMRISSMLQIEDVLDIQTKELSGGQKRKLCIAMALIRNPSVVILDEPTAGLDVQSRQVVWKVIHDNRGITGFVTCHSLEEGETVSNRILVVTKGKAAFCGTAADMRSMFKCGYYISFIDENVNMDEILEFIQDVEPGAEMHHERAKSILVPDRLEVADLLEAIEQNKERFGVTKYTVHVENLEETLRKLIEDEEAQTR